jgi:hypothetical protein
MKMHYTTRSAIAAHRTKLAALNRAQPRTAQAATAIDAMRRLTMLRIAALMGLTVAALTTHAHGECDTHQQIAHCPAERGK